jgi:predicted solute-binding protein
MNTCTTVTNFLISMNVLLHLSRALEFDLRYIKMYYIEFQYSYGRSGVARREE